MFPHSSFQKGYFETSLFLLQLKDKDRITRIAISLKYYDEFVMNS